MIGSAHDGAGPRLGLPRRYDETLGLGQGGHIGLRLTSKNVSDLHEFAANENLSKISLPESRKFSHADLGKLLQQHGPVMFGWKTPAGGLHNSVLVGVSQDNGYVYFHDPSRGFGPNSKMTLDEFNERLLWDEPYAMLFRKGAGGAKSS
jgi:hypothetical protein